MTNECVGAFTGILRVEWREVRQKSKKSVSVQRWRLISQLRIILTVVVALWDILDADDGVYRAAVL